VNLVLPHDPMRDAIVGDLHEEYLGDIARVGRRSAQRRYWLRAAGVVAHAASDFMRWRSWVSTTPPADAAAASNGMSLARVREIGSDAGFIVLALGVIAFGVVANIVMFAATQGPATPVANAAPALTAPGIAGIVLLVGCAAIAAVILCTGPRWRRRHIRSA
jgi:hypothetical protein